MAFAALAANAQPGMMRMPAPEPDPYTLEVGKLTMVVDAGQGAKVMSFKYDGKETVDGVEYGVFSIEYVTLKSSVVKITATYGAKDTTVMKGHTAITVGDIDKDAKVNSRDVTELLRVENDFTKVAKGSEGGYAFELADCDKNTKVNSIDVSIMLRMINDLVASN